MMDNMAEASNDTSSSDATKEVQQQQAQSSNTTEEVQQQQAQSSNTTEEVQQQQAQSSDKTEKGQQQSSVLPTSSPISSSDTAEEKEQQSSTLLPPTDVNSTSLDGVDSADMAEAIAKEAVAKAKQLREQEEVKKIRESLNVTTNETASE